MNFNEIKPKRWKELREVLSSRIRNMGVRPPSRYTRHGYQLALEGWLVAAIYDPFTEELSVWNKGGNNYAGGKITIAQLELVENAVSSWVDDIEGGII